MQLRICNWPDLYFIWWEVGQGGVSIILITSIILDTLDIYIQYLI